MRAAAVEGLSLSLGNVQGAGWQAVGATLELDLSGGAGALTIREMQLPEPIGKLSAATIRCASMVLNDAAISCASARFHAPSAALDKPDFSGRFEYRQSDGSLSFSTDDLPIAGSKLALSANYGPGGWRFEAKGLKLKLAPLLALAQKRGIAAGAEVSGQAGLEARFIGGEGRPTEAVVSLAFDAMTLNARDGKLATDKLVANLSATASQLPNGWKFEAKLDSPGGQGYSDPVFIDFAQTPARAQLAGAWDSAGNRLQFTRFSVDQDKALSINGNLVMQLGEASRVEDAQITIAAALLPAAYRSYLQPLLIGTLFDSLESSGKVNGEVGIVGGAIRKILLNLEGLHLDDTKRRFALYGVNGQVNWSADPASVTESRLRWEGGLGYKLQIGGGEMELVTAGRHIALKQATKVPILDGALRVQQLVIDNAAQPDMRVAFDGRVDPISMEGFSHALGWPVFSGKLGGVLPKAEYRDGHLAVLGTLQADVFDGHVAVDNLRLDQPFGVVPKLAADMKIRNIDLQSATSAFSFGRIEGRLDGDVKGLRLERWRPVAFDGKLYTTPGDKSSHRISQRAVENISNLGGGGASGALSRGFMRFFKDFGYDRLALGCRLQNGICYMSGLEPAKQGGYYIVKGNLVPRIDVIGFATKVSWDSFVEQLKSVTESEGPVVR